MDPRYSKQTLQPLVRPFKLNNLEGTGYHESQTGNEIVNLSTHHLTKAENDLLERGLKFVPSPDNMTHSPLLKAASDFGRRMKLIKFFHYKKRIAENFTLKSNWEPPDKNIPKDILKPLSEMINEIRNLPTPKAKPNLELQERNAIKSLQNDDSIVIKKADKGSATVIMDKTDYIFECTRQLANGFHYEKIDTSRQAETAEKITEILKEMNTKELISNKQLMYLKPPPNPRPRRFYTLPKIHKPIQSWTKPQKIPPGRPIISNCKSETEKVAEYIDAYLKTKSTQHPAYIKNTQDFVSKIKNITIPPNALLVTLDVESMYTNINNIDGIKAVDEIFDDEKESELYPYIRKLLQITLENNDFEFNGDTYLQRSGVSMGIRFAPSFADIFMAKWEHDAFEKSPDKPHFYCRFLDDIFMIWTHSIDKLNKLLAILNNHHPSIKLKATIHETEVDFLDTTIYKPNPDSTRLFTKVYFKPTDTHALLHKKSFHPKSTFKGIVKSQIIRFKSICSTNADFNHSWNTLYKALRKRNYSKRWLREIRSKVLYEIECNERAGLDQAIPGNSQWGQVQCEKRHECETCTSSLMCHNIKSLQTDHVYPINGTLGCQSNNVVYLIDCKLCGAQYVGQTKRKLHTRFLEHRRALLLWDDSYAVVKHFMEEHPQHHLRADNLPISVIGIEQIPTLDSEEKNLQKRIERENFWIDTLVTWHPFGMNEDRMKWGEKIKRKSSPAIPFIVPFCNTGKQAGQIAKTYYNAIQNEYEHIYTHKPVIAYRKHRSLHNLLVSSTL